LFVIEPNIDHLPFGLEDVSLVQLGDEGISADINVLLVDHKEFLTDSTPSGVKLDFKGIW
jgi:UDP-N-acetyl-D-mannosaminuronic acid dehydrogenase